MFYKFNNWFSSVEMHLNDVDGMANNLDPGQTALGAARPKS